MTINPLSLQPYSVTFQHLVPALVFALLFSGSAVGAQKKSPPGKPKSEAAAKPSKKKILESPPPNPEAAEVQEYSFTPHISATARTGKQWSFAFQRAVGANINTNFLLGAFTLAVLPRLEIGTIPMFYATEGHNFNVSLKYNFWRGEEFNWALAYSGMAFDLDTSQLPAPYTDRDIGFVISAFQILLNYFPHWTLFKFGINVNSIQTQLTGDVSAYDKLLSLESRSEIGLDISRSLSDQFDVTIGMGTQRESGISAYENVHFGFGPSVRWYRPKKLFSSPTLGINYTPAKGDFMYLLSTSFY